MSDIFDDRNDSDNLVEFLTKLARFGIDQCLHFAHIISTKQRFIENLSTYEDKRVNELFSLISNKSRIDLIRFN
jgi:hypothetical protein